MNIYQLQLYALIFNLVVVNPFFIITGIKTIFSFPLSYFPSLILLIILKLRNPFKNYKSLSIISFSIFIYSIIISFNNGTNIIKTIPYAISIPLLFFLSNSSPRGFDKVLYSQDQNSINKWYKYLIAFLSVCFLITSLFSLKEGTYSNFILSLNKNGTSFYVSIISFICLYSYKKIANCGKLMIKIFIISLLIFTFFNLSRTLIIFIPLILINSFITNKFLREDLFSPKAFMKYNFIYFLAIFFIIIPFLYDSIEVAFTRVSGVQNIIFSLFSEDFIKPGEIDFRRVNLIKVTLEIIKENFWFGSGAGIENYLNSFKNTENILFDAAPGKSHLFYVSYFLEYGFFGMSLILSFFIIYYRKFKKLYLNSNKLLPPFQNIIILIALLMLTNEYILMPDLYLIMVTLLMIMYSYKNKYFDYLN